MSINRRIIEARKRMSQEASTTTGFWGDIMPRINQGIVIPIISDSFRVEQIFRASDEKTNEPSEEPRSRDSEQNPEQDKETTEPTKKQESEDSELISGHDEETNEPTEEQESGDSDQSLEPDEETNKSTEKQKSGDRDLTLYEQLIKEWANWIEYPMQDCHNLARVAQYYLVEQKDAPQARTKFLEFLKSILLTIAQDDKDYEEVVEQLKLHIPEHRFSEIVYAIDYPRFPQDVEDPLRLLAKLPLPIYITTSYSDFLERALEAENKKPLTQVCFWSGIVSSAKPEHRPNPDFIPEPTKPLVYHLYGLEDYPQTLVLSEDDYINFLISMVEDTNTLNPIVPLNLRRALSESHLILLGYELGNWDFRVLFRFIQKFRRDEFSPRGMMIQLKRDEKTIGNIEKTLEYLNHYFDRKRFDVEWNNAERFIQRLWDEWNTYRRG